ncbi:MAG: hypothetical protein R3337_10630, partial [Gammaproteobacteria bacterium]|nr:hypothetical protein [Gammaproteobacteria bacterium]
VRSNITVGPPFQLAIYPKDSFALSRHVTIKENSSFYLAFKSAWQEGLKQAFTKLPPFEWETEGDKVTKISDGQS